VAEGLLAVPHIIKKEADRHIKNTGDMVQPRCADTVGPALVFLDLLEGNAERFSQFFLRQAKLGSAQPDAATDMKINLA
jgi:hypothetical protein